MKSKLPSCFLSNDSFIWSEHDADLEIIEPQLLVSCDFNYFQFSRKLNRPPERGYLRLTNHGDYPVAFKIQTTDNYSYFVDQVYGIIPGRRMIVNSKTRTINMATIQIYHRVYSCYPDDEQYKYFNSPQKDKLFVLLAPYFCSTFSPAAIFHNERPFEKLRILLHYTGREVAGKTKVKQLLIRGTKGWCTFHDSASKNERKHSRRMKSKNSTQSKKSQKKSDISKPSSKKKMEKSKKKREIKSENSRTSRTSKKEKNGMLKKLKSDKNRRTKEIKSETSRNSENQKHQKMKNLNKSETSGGLKKSKEKTENDLLNVRKAKISIETKENSNNGIEKPAAMRENENNPNFYNNLLINK